MNIMDVDFEAVFGVLPGGPALFRRTILHPEFQTLWITLSKKWTVFSLRAAVSVVFLPSGHGPFLRTRTTVFWRIFSPTGRFFWRFFKKLCDLAAGGLKVYQFFLVIKTF